MKSITTLIVRAISGLVGIAIIAGIAFGFKERGLVGLCFFVIIVVIIEFSHLIFVNRRAPSWLRWYFCFLTLLTAAATVFWPYLIVPLLMLDILFLVSAAILGLNKYEDLPFVLNQIGLMLIGVFYCGLLPGTVASLIYLPQGQKWFLGYLTVVFAGDTLAYFFGKTWGERKLMPAISPQKTVAGSWGGVFGSCVAMAVLQYFFLKQVPLVWMLPIAVFTALFAQMGDIFESLVKRVAQVKDSGRLMPGHGGLTDRVDGLFFAVPVFYVAAAYFSALF